MEHDVSRLVQVFKKVVGDMDHFVDLNEDLSQVGFEKIMVGFPFASLAINLEYIDPSSGVSQQLHAFGECVKDEGFTVLSIQLGFGGPVYVWLCFIGKGLVAGLDSPSVVCGVETLPAGI